MAWGGLGWAGGPGGGLGWPGVPLGWPVVAWGSPGAILPSGNHLGFGGWLDWAGMAGWTKLG